MVGTGHEADDHALVCTGDGVRLSLTQRVTTISIDVMIGVRDKTVVLTSFNSAGGLINTITVEEDKKVVLQSIDPIDSFTASSDSVEAVLPFICLQSIDIDEVINEAEEEVRSGNTTVDEQYSENPERTSVLKEDATRKVRELYEGRSDPSAYINEMNTTLSSVGLPGMSFNWPLDWRCVTINIVALVALEALAEALEVPTIADLPESDAVEVITGFGYKEAVALKFVKMLGPWLGGALIVAMAIYNCSEAAE